MDRTKIVEMVLDAVRDQIAEGSDAAEHVGVVDEETPLLGEGAPIDSLGLVSVIVQVEDSLMSSFGAAVSLVDEKAMSQRNSPFRSVGGLATYAAECAAAAVEGAEHRG